MSYSGTTLKKGIKIKYSFLGNYEMEDMMPQSI
jgi:hypothetical protein